MTHVIKPCKTDQSTSLRKWITHPHTCDALILCKELGWASRLNIIPFPFWHGSLQGRTIAVSDIQSEDNSRLSDAIRMKAKLKLLKMGDAVHYCPSTGG